MESSKTQAAKAWQYVGTPSCSWSLVWRNRQDRNGSDDEMTHDMAKEMLTTSHRAAQKLRKHIMKQIEKLPKDGNSNIDMAQFEAIDSALEK